MRIISSSRIGRVMKCPPSGKLPQVSVSHEAGERGTAVHKFLEDYAIKRSNGMEHEEAQSEALADVPVNYRDACERIDLGKIRVTDWSDVYTEIRFVWDPKTDATYIAKSDDDSWPEWMLPGKADLVIHDRSESLLVIVDHKTGRGKIEHVSINAQMQTLALAAQRANPWADRVMVVFLFWDLESGSGYEQTAEFDTFQIDMFAAEYAEFILETFPKTDPKDITQYAIGPWCRFCPAITQCPAQGAIIRQLCVDGISSDELAQRAEVHPQTLANLGAGYRRLQAIKAMAAFAESTFHAIANQTPIPLGNGEVLGPVEKYGRKKIDGRAAYDWLADNYDEELAIEAVTMEATQKGIRDALRKRSLPQAPTLRALMQSVPVKQRKYWGVEVHSETPQLPASDDNEIE